MSSACGGCPGTWAGEPQQPASRDLVGAMLSGDEHDGPPSPHCGVDQAVLADPQGAALTVSQLVIASQGA